MSQYILKVVIDFFFQQPSALDGKVMTEPGFGGYKSEKLRQGILEEVTLKKRRNEPHGSVCDVLG